MNIYKISQTENDDYDTFDSAIVAAETKKDAVMTHPTDVSWDGSDDSDMWTSWDKVEVEFIGTTDRDLEGVILASFNAG